MVNVYRIINSLGAKIFPTSIMGRVPNSHSIHVQNPTKSPFSKQRLGVEVRDMPWRAK
jgi:hypothetical protein